MTKPTLAFALAAFALAGPAILGTPALAAPAPAPKIVVIDKSAIMQASKVGQDVARQVQSLANQAKSDLTAQGRALQTEGRSLQQQVAILSPDLKATRVAGCRPEEGRAAQGGLLSGAPGDGAGAGPDRPGRRQTAWRQHRGGQ